MLWTTRTPSRLSRVWHLWMLARRGSVRTWWRHGFCLLRASRRMHATFEMRGLRSPHLLSSHFVTWVRWSGIKTEASHFETGQLNPFCAWSHIPSTASGSRHFFCSEPFKSFSDLRAVIHLARSAVFARPGPSVRKRSWCETRLVWPLSQPWNPTDCEDITHHPHAVWEYYPSAGELGDEQVPALPVESSSKPEEGGRAGVETAQPRSRVLNQNDGQAKLYRKGHVVGDHCNCKAKATCRTERSYLHFWCRQPGSGWGGKVDKKEISSRGTVLDDRITA